MSASNQLAYNYSPLNSGIESLDEFRLLTLVPGSSNAEIHCNITHASLAEHPPYEALSYTWSEPKGSRSFVPCRGDPDSRHSIKIGDENLFVGYNLMCALKQLRDEKLPRTLWIDALCINQADNAERSEQVKAMARIFGQASRVLAWLGEDDKFVDLAFDSMEELFWATKATTWRYCSERLNLPLSSVTEAHVTSVIDDASLSNEHIPGSPFNRIPDNLGNYKTDLMAAFRLVPSAVNGTDTSLKDSALQAFGDQRTFARYLVSEKDDLLVDGDYSKRTTALFQVFNYRLYWRRLWIVQELLSAAEVTIICGSRSLDLRSFILVSLALYPGWDAAAGNSILLKSLDFEVVDILRRSIAKATGIVLQRTLKAKYSLATAMATFSHAVCSEPRDNIYALFNISLQSNLVIDYDCPVSDVFIKATKEMIHQEQKLDIIFQRPSYDQAECPQYDAAINTPSWVPRYETRLVYGSLCRPEESLYTTGGEFRGRPFHIWGTDMVGRVLPLYGYFYQRITQTHPEFDPLEDDEHLWKSVLELKKTLGIDSESKLTTICRRVRESPREATEIEWKEFLFWRTLVMDSYSRSNGRTYRLADTVLNTVLNTHLEQDIDTALSHISTPPERLIGHLWHVASGKMFCMLQGGLMALVHGDAQVGDIVFVAEGASVPLIIRPVDSSFQLGDSKETLKNSPDFTFMGGAHVYGIMDGEVLDMAEKGKWARQSIRLI